MSKHPVFGSTIGNLLLLMNVIHHEEITTTIFPVLRKTPHLTRQNENVINPGYSCSFAPNDCHSEGEFLYCESTSARAHCENRYIPAIPTKLVDLVTHQ